MSDIRAGVAFIYIAIGYALSVFGEKGDVASIIVLLMVFVASGVLIGVEFMLATFIHFNVDIYTYMLRLNRELIEME